ncbi:xanthine dehydrogenase family protein molybdopterin-binding subunit [Caulobacter sp. S45]|uniref:xanthine dehydrogenase family protein molybdopterin-binding subunit n=1 Tax=Caulobacter sp. S45 TaxID=1641861 RepID=UPI00131E1106|nr:xanthine dehydrogenase family protein molybdopterin-binding subunit [Caulobacter sp. S45]
MNAPANLAPSRRTLLFAGLSAAGGLTIGLPIAAQASARIHLSDGQDVHPELTAWLVIDPDDTITIRIPHQEMGQGTSTALAMLVAEELNCDWSKVRIEYASANRNQREGGKLYRSMMTAGSSGVRTSVQMMQQAGASARERLRLAAAQQWKVDPTQCSVDKGRCLHLISNRSLRFGELAPAAALIKMDVEPDIKTTDQYTLVGKWTPRLDTLPKVDGSAQFGIDTQVPGMVYAAVVSCPEFGGKLKAVDEAPVKGLRGVIAVVKLDDAVAVVADRYWRAKAALDLLQPEWAPGANATVDSARLDKAYRDALDGPMVTAKSQGDAATALAQPGAKVVEALYEVPYLAHAPMEPLNCTVTLAPERVDVWIGTQSPMDVLKLAAKESGVAPENVYVHNQFLGGGFGRRGKHDELVHAIAVAKVVNKPVKLIWHREQDMRRDRFRPQAAIRFKAVLGADGKPTAMDTRVAVGSLLRSLGLNDVPSGIEPMAVEVLATHAYKVPNNQVGVMLKNAHIPVMFWRSVGASQNTFFLESFIDELAHAAGQDPYQFRRSLLLDRPDYLGVLDTIAKHGNWGDPLPPGRGRGIAIVETYGTVTGQVAEVTVGADGKVTVDRVVAAVDCYHAVNPNTIAQQIEGGVVYGLTAALYGEIQIKDGAPVQANFNTYKLLKMSETPKIEVHMSLSGGKKWGGIGEPSVAPIAPAVCNAIFAATGKRVRRLPLKNIDLRKA